MKAFHPRSVGCSSSVGNNWKGSRASRRLRRGLLLVFLTCGLTSVHAGDLNLLDVTADMLSGPPSGTPAFSEPIPYGVVNNLLNSIGEATTMDFTISPVGGDGEGTPFVYPQSERNLFGNSLLVGFQQPLVQPSEFTIIALALTLPPSPTRSYLGGKRTALNVQNRSSTRIGLRRSSTLKRSKRLRRS